MNVRSESDPGGTGMARYIKVKVAYRLTSSERT
jgi:hypothetical protein